MKESQRCAAKAKQTGERCRLTSVPGAVVCRFHGGRAPQVKRRANARLADARIRDIARRVGVRYEVDPAFALLQQVWEAAGNVHVLREMLHGIDSHPELESHGGDIDSSEGLAAVLGFYTSERERLVRFSKLCVDAGIAERAVRIAEHLGEALGELVENALNDPELRLSSEQREVSRVVFARHIRMATAESA